jgi:hypothetical protein
MSRSPLPSVAPSSGDAISAGGSALGLLRRAHKELCRREASAAVAAEGAASSLVAATGTAMVPIAPGSRGAVLSSSPPLLPPPPASQPPPILQRSGLKPQHQHQHQHQQHHQQDVSTRIPVVSVGSFASAAAAFAASGAPSARRAKTGPGMHVLGSMDGLTSGVTGVRVGLLPGMRTAAMDKFNGVSLW